jgi:hypothetical protein
MKPLPLTDNQMAQIHSAAAPLSPADKGEFIRTVVIALEALSEIGDGAVYNGCKQAQAKFWRPPDTREHGAQHRGKFHRPAEAEPIT